MVKPEISILAKDPSKADTLSSEEAEALLWKCIDAQSALAARLQGSTRQKGNPPEREAEQCEIIDSKELARRWNVPESWIREFVRPRTADQIPHIKMGRYIRFEWGSADLLAWYDRRRSKSGTRSKC